MNKTVIALVVAALLGGGATIFAVLSGEGDSAPAASVRAAPLPIQVAGSGLVEASSGTIAIGTPVPGIVSKVDVSWGDLVQKGQPLFEIDDRDIANTRPTALAELAKSEATLAPASHNLEAARRLQGDGFITKQDFVQREADFTLAQSSIRSARAQLARIDAERARRIVRAPISGRILKINVRPGEYADSAATTQPVMLIGSDDRLFIRAEVDEHDAWRVKPGLPATGYVPGNHDLHAALGFVRIEPYVLPKTNLAGGATERTDTRVLQVIYSFDPATLPVYVGQHVDVVIDTQLTAPKPAKPAR